MTGEHSTHGTGEGMDGTIQQPWMPPGARHQDLLCWVCPALVRITMPIQGLQSEINFLLYMSLQTLTGLLKKEVSQKLFYSLFKNAMTLFHKVLRGQGPINLELQRKGTD